MNLNRPNELKNQKFKLNLSFHELAYEQHTHIKMMLLKRVLKRLKRFRSFSSFVFTYFFLGIQPADEGLSANFKPKIVRTSLLPVYCVVNCSKVCRPQCAIALDDRVCK